MDDTQRRLDQLETSVKRLMQVNKGIDDATMGWDGEVLTVRQLRVLDQILPKVEWTALNTHQNGWVNSVVGRELKYKIIATKFILVNGVLGLGTFANGTTVFTLPAGIVPSVYWDQMVVGHAFPSSILLQTTPTGAVNIWGATGNSFLNVSMIVPYE